MLQYVTSELANQSVVLYTKNMKPTKAKKMTRHRDPIVEETRAIRAELFRKAGGSVEQFIKWIRECEKRSNAKFVDLGRSASGRKISRKTNGNK